MLKTSYFMIIFLILFIGQYSIQADAHHVTEDQEEVLLEEDAALSNKPINSDEAESSIKGGDFFADINQEKTLPDTKLSWIIAKVLGSLIIIIGLIFFTLYVLKKQMNRIGRPLKGVRLIESVESLPLGDKKYIHMVKIMERIFVLGVDQHHISVLSKIEKGSFIDQPAVSTESFHALLEKK